MKIKSIAVKIRRNVVKIRRNAVKIKSNAATTTVGVTNISTREATRTTARVKISSSVATIWMPAANFQRDRVTIYCVERKKSSSE